MIDAAMGLLEEFGVIGVGGVSVLSVGLWLRRAQRIADWLRMAAVVAITTGIGAIAGVVDLERLAELLTTAYELAPL